MNGNPSGPDEPSHAADEPLPLAVPREAEAELPEPPLEAVDDPHDPYAALKSRDYRFFLTGNFLASLGLQMQKVAVGWEIVQRAPESLDLKDRIAWASLRVGWVGLVQVLPVIMLAIPVGHVVDRVSRKRVIMGAAALYSISALGLAYASHLAAPLGWMYFCLLLAGVARSFQQPAKAAFLPQLVEKSSFSNAVTWNTSGFHLASILGPLLAGLLLHLYHNAALVFVIDAVAVFTLLALLTMVVGRPYKPPVEPVTLATMGAGISFVWRTKLILGAITLDMFAVLLGGAVALLPIYATEILHVGALGLGCLFSAPAIGALTMTFVLAHRRPLERAGPAMLWSVAGFGLATIVFGLSDSYWLSLTMLLATGALDAISVIVRHTVVQVLTPNQKRGRVAAVNSMFIGASNELGGYESGQVAYWFGPTFSVVSGGVGTLLVVALVAIAWPSVRKYGRLGSGGGEQW